MKERVVVCMLDVGQGDSTLIVLPDNRAVVFDCADDRVLRQVLADWSCESIEAFVLSHLDRDHIAGALPFLHAFEGEIRHVYLSPDRDVSGEHEEAKRAKALLDHVAEQSQDKGTRRRRWELHGPLETVQGDGRVVRDADRIARHREQVIRHHQQWTLPPYRHLTDDLRGSRADLLKVPCAGTVIVTLHLDGRLKVLPPPGGRHEEVIDRWSHPLCRASRPDA